MQPQHRQQQRYSSNNRSDQKLQQALSHSNAEGNRRQNDFGSTSQSSQKSLSNQQQQNAQSLLMPYGNFNSAHIQSTSRMMGDGAPTVQIYPYTATVHPTGQHRVLNSPMSALSPNVGASQGVASHSAKSVPQGDFWSECVELAKDSVYFWCQSSAGDGDIARLASPMSPRTFNEGPYAPVQLPANAHPIFVDKDHNYIPFHSDFGPLSIAHIYRFCVNVQSAIEQCQQSGKRVLIVTCDSPSKCTNAALLASAFAVLQWRQTPQQACEPFLKHQPQLPLVQFRDAGYGQASYWISIQDCCQALYKGIIQYQLLDLAKFDVEEYEFYEKVENGDFNWVIPGFFLAHATPHEHPQPHLLQYHIQVQAGRIVPLRPINNRFKPLIELERFLEYLKSDKMSVRAMVRLNNKVYDRQRVIQGGLDHYELYFPDGSNPAIDPIVKRFLLICDMYLPYHRLPFFQQNPGTAPWVQTEPQERRDKRGGVAVHCKAGLGRTGTLICCWMIKNMGWTARECISWCRLMRPGSVVGPQQNWLEAMEQQLLQWGESDRMQRLQALQELAQSLNYAQPSHSTKRTGDDVDDEQDGLMELAVNEGTEQLCQVSMGMQVPVQPNKQQRHQQQQQQQQQLNSRFHYNLRSNSIDSSNGSSNGSSADVDGGSNFVYTSAAGAKQSSTDSNQRITRSKSKGSLPSNSNTLSQSSSNQLFSS